MFFFSIHSHQNKMQTFCVKNSIFTNPQTPYAKTHKLHTFQEQQQPNAQYALFKAHTHTHKHQHTITSANAK